MTETVPRGNLMAKIIRLSKKLGESSTLDKTAEMPEEEREALKQELDEARREKLRTKMFHTTKALKTDLKKSKALEIQKQVRKIKDARAALDSAKPANALDVDKDQELPAVGKKRGKAVGVEDIARYEKELEMLKSVHVDALAEKTLRNKVLKHSELKHQTVVTDLLPAAPEPNTKNNTPDLSLDEKTMVSTLESRILGNKSAQASISKLLEEILGVIRPPAKAQPTPDDDKNNNNNKKRGLQDNWSKRNAKRVKGEDPALTASSTFVESLNADEVLERKNRGDNDEYYDDAEFDELYNGDKKKNRPGQRQRRQLYEKQFGRNANHLKRLRDETRLVKGKANARRDSPAAAAAAPPSGRRGGDGHGGSGLLKPEEFHPSWQAKRQEQEMIAKALSGGGAPSNNKIVFDDSD